MFTRYRILSHSRSRWREPISDPSKPSCTLQPAATPANIGNGGDVEERRSGCAVTKACATHLDLDAHIVNQLQRDPVTFEVPIHRYGFTSFFLRSRYLHPNVWCQITKYDSGF
ncbi:hypothetical protein ALC60_06509 [Trachymyrmex zeteki]|uniref:Uncharacterized protein n=1 Tax=Mycetomoellerius zeteki TaxID=64791 RepID=A0A151X2F7_9HYME|nr:hypothetical protein ALC60_06509 [Trachymyrmex zeteki]